MKFLVLIFLIFSMTTAIASSKKKRSKKKKKPSSSYYDKSLVDRTHKKFSKRILRMSDNIDSFFADTKHEGIPNRSKLKISLQTRFREARGPYMVPDINYRLVLPRTEKRLRLFVENENEDTSSETSKASETLAEDARPNENATAAGLRYMIESTGIKYYTDAGVIVTVPPQIFLKFTAKRSVEFTNWVLKINEQVKWVNSRGFTSDLDLDFDKRLSRKFLLRMVNNTFWNDQDYVIRFENGPSLFQTLTKKSALAYHAHVVTLNKPEFVVDNYILQVTYRERVYKNWLFMELTPFTNFPRSKNFHRTPGFIVEFEAIFGHI